LEEPRYNITKDREGKCKKSQESPAAEKVTKTVLFLCIKTKTKKEH